MRRNNKEQLIWEGGRDSYLEERIFFGALASPSTGKNWSNRRLSYLNGEKERR
jgi:hypothetical protein